MATTETDYSKLVLTEDEQVIFDRFKESDTAVLTQEEYLILYGKRLILPEINGITPAYPKDVQSGVCELSQRGKEMRAYQKSLEKSEHTAKVRHWVPVAISTALSVVAIIISIIALCRTF